MMILKRKISKEEINELPIAEFSGNITTIQTVEEANNTISFLREQEIVGIDTETRPSFKRGQVYKVALLQVSTKDHCFLFRLNMIGLTPGIISFLEDNKIRKIGLSLHDDFMMLHKRGSFNQSGCIDLQDYIHTFGIHELSLQKIFAILFGKKISKNQRLSNWEAELLSDKQKKYAATDAWACILIYEQLLSLQKSHDYELDPKEEIEEYNESSASAK